MQIIKAKNLGWCEGVKRTVALAEKAASEYGAAYTIGELIHSRRALDDLQKRGIYSAASLKDIPDGAPVVIRAHGAPPELIREIKESGHPLIDATCPSVKAIHKALSDYSALGYNIVILGDPNHPEVKASAAYAPGAVVTDGKIPVREIFEDGKVLVVAQTTFDPQEYQKILEFNKNSELNDSKTVEFINTICYTTNIRQTEVIELSKQADAVFVVGDRGSANTTKLFESASAIRPGRAFLISEAADLKSVAYKNFKLPCIASGASAPQELIMEVINTMEQENMTVDTAVEEVSTVPAAETIAVATEAKETVEKKKPAQPMTMADALKSSHYNPVTLREGKKVKATVESAEPTGLSVSIEGVGKNDSGFIDKDEMELDGSYDPANYQKGDIIEAVIIPKTDSKQKSYNLSKKKCDEIKVADEAVKQILEGKEFSLVCSQAIKGGLLGKLGSYTVFVPASQLRIGFVKTLEDYVGKKLRLRMLPPREEEATAEGEEKRHSNPKRIVASQRVILEEEKLAKEEAFWEVMQVNNIIKGKVKRFAEFGAFVSIMGYDCLAHISDLSWYKIKDPSEVLEIGKTYDFVVIKVDRETGKVSLGYKQLQKQPYELFAETHSVGDVVKGTVERIKDFGAFVAIEPGIDGLVHVSEIGYKWIANASEALKVGDVVEAKITSFDKNKITLSMKALLDPPAQEEVIEEEGDKPARNSRFSKRPDAADNKGDKKDRRPRKGDKEDNGEPHEYVSTGKGNPTFAALFKDVDISKLSDDKDE